MKKANLKPTGGSTVSQSENEQVQETALAVIEQPEVEPVTNPLTERLKGVVKLNKLIEKRKRLAEMTEDVADFEESSDGENETVVLKGKSRGSEIPIQRPEVVAKVIAMLKADLEFATQLNESEILAIAV